MARNWIYDVFPSFSGEDVRQTFLSHFLKELDRKLITAFKDNEIERSQSLDPELKRAIRDSRIAVVIFSKNYASSSWCLNELLEIVKCKDESNRLVVIPVFYGLDPSHVRKQIGDFGIIFEKTCQNRKEDEINLWRRALIDVANTLGYHSTNWVSEAKMIEELANDVLVKLSLNPPKDDVEDFVGIEDHIGEMSSLLRLESEEVRMVGIWGSSGIGKTTIARALFSRLSRHFQGSVYIDSAFLSKCRKDYHKANTDDYNMKLHLQRNFLSEILGKRDIKMDHIGVMGERLKHHKLLIVIDDLDDQVVLDALAGHTQWFGLGSKIIAITKDKHLLRSHGIYCIYSVGLPSEKQALQMFCRAAFRQDSPPDGFMGLASEVRKRVGSLPLGLKIFGSLFRGRSKEDWVDMLPRLRKRLDGKIEKTLRVSYDELDSREDKALFRHIACLFNGAKIDYIIMVLADSDLDVKIGLKNLVDKSLIHVRGDIVGMHCLVQEMGKEIVRTQSSEPGEQEFLLDCKDICDVLEDNTGTRKVLGILLDMSGIDELHIHKRAFEKMRNLYFLKINNKPYKKVRWHVSEGFNYLPPKLKVLSWIGCPLRCLPSMFCPQHLVKLKMQNSKLEKLWEGVHPLTGLKRINFSGSKSLKEIPDLSMATCLEKLLLRHCSSLVKITSSIRHLHKLLVLEMSWCTKLEALPSGFNLKSLDRLDLGGCSRLRRFPDISSNITWLNLNRTATEEFPSNLRLENLKTLHMKEIKSQKLWEGVQPLTCLTTIDLSGSEKLKEIPNLLLATNLEWMNLGGCSSLVELPSSSIENLNKLTYLSMENCTKLEVLPTDINLKSLECLNLSGCSELRFFPDISRNVLLLVLNQTAIEDIPWWVNTFSRLSCLRMRDCNSFKYKSSTFIILKRLKEADFQDSGDSHDIFDDGKDYNSFCRYQDCVRIVKNKIGERNNQWIYRSFSQLLACKSFAEIETLLTEVDPNKERKALEMYLRDFCYDYNNKEKSFIRQHPTLWQQYLKEQEVDVRLQAHKFILSARSEEFMKIFESDKFKASSKLETITLSELKQEELEAFVEFIYSDGSMLSEKAKQHVRSLYRAADKFFYFFFIGQSLAFSELLKFQPSTVRTQTESTTLPPRSRCRLGP
ncbi:PREDICTED: disease resistance protein RPS6-like isoform X1 [Camelina sativa]|uniref:Disease resistance protein RPS6-like isoform X1 n=1 Tax=Camelina sativa TaxID=90675 RepID=A0ABM1QBF9_CAMSA|nr:PREDICTED: disease resistance protein RPS6-like isoform X1 [Camelina sativa]